MLDCELHQNKDSGPWDTDTASWGSQQSKRNSATVNHQGWERTDSEVEHFSYVSMLTIILFSALLFMARAEILSLVVKSWSLMLLYNSVGYQQRIWTILQTGGSVKSDRQMDPHYTLDSSMKHLYPHWAALLLAWWIGCGSHLQPASGCCLPLHLLECISLYCIQYVGVQVILEF